jgi:hypothetical protein
LVHEFIQSRRRGLEKFLYRVLEHPDLSPSPYVKSFLLDEDAAFKECVRQSEKLKPKRLDRIGDSLKSTWNAYVVTGKHVELESDEASTAVDNMQVYINQIDALMAKLVDKAQALTERSRKTSQAMHDFGQGFISYGLAEGDVLGQMLTRVGAVIDQLSVTAGDHASEEMQKLLEPLAESSRSLESVRYSITLRADRRQQYVQELQQLEAHQLAYSKVLGQAGKETQALNKERQVEESLKKTEALKAEFDLITVRLLKDFAAFQSRKCREVKAILLNFVELQIAYHRQSMSTWESMTPILANTEFTAAVGQVWADAAARPLAGPYASSSSPSSSSSSSYAAAGGAGTGAGTGAGAGAGAGGAADRLSGSGGAFTGEGEARGADWQGQGQGQGQSQDVWQTVGLGNGPAAQTASTASTSAAASQAQGFEDTAGI